MAMFKVRPVLAAVLAASSLFSLAVRRVGASRSPTVLGPVLWKMKC
jgi:hypothetical protein